MDPLTKIRQDLMKISRENALNVKYIRVVCPCCKDCILQPTKLLAHSKSKTHIDELRKYLIKQSDILNALNNELEIV